MENSAPKTLRVSHSYHSPCYWFNLRKIKKTKTKAKTKQKTESPFYFRKGLDIHIAVDRAREATGSAPSLALKEYAVPRSGPTK